MRYALSSVVLMGSANELKALLADGWEPFQTDWLPPDLGKSGDWRVWLRRSWTPNTVTLGEVVG